MRNISETDGSTWKEKTYVITITTGVCIFTWTTTEHVPRRPAILAASCATTELAEKWLTPAKSQFRIPLNRLRCRPPVNFVFVTVENPLVKKLDASEIVE